MSNGDTLTVFLTIVIWAIFFNLHDNDQKRHTKLDSCSERHVDHFLAAANNDGVTVFAAAIIQWHFASFFGRCQTVTF